MSLRLISLLLPGNYRVTVEASGFKKTIRSGVRLPLGTRVEVSVQLELVTLSESVSVTGEAPLLATSSAAAGRVVDNRSVMELPVLANSTMFLARMAPGVQTGGVNIRWGLHSNSVGGGYDVYANGNIGGAEYTVDGVPNMTLGRRPAQLPYTDTIQEFKIETHNFDASVEHTSNVSVTMMSRSGTNQLHGAATYEHWQQRWQGAGFFVMQLYYRNIAAAMARGDTAGAKSLRDQNVTPPGRYNNIALSTGGPLVIPKVFNGRDRLFFYVGVAGVQSSRTEMRSSIQYKLPTMAQRQGDFSGLLKVSTASLYQIYDPLSTRGDPARPSHYIGDPIPGNVLPQSRITNPAYKCYSKFLGSPGRCRFSATFSTTANWRTSRSATGRSTTGSTPTASRRTRPRGRRRATPGCSPTVSTISAPI
jgi:hypothetical protein